MRQSICPKGSNKSYDVFGFVLEAVELVFSISTYLFSVQNNGIVRLSTIVKILKVIIEIDLLLGCFILLLYILLILQGILNYPCHLYGSIYHRMQN